MSDPHIKAVQAKLEERSARGLIKYGVDLTRGDLSYIEWLQHLQEELLDAAAYIERIISDLKGEDHDR